MKGLDELDFHIGTTKRGQFVGRCGDFPDLKTRKHKSRLDAIDDIVSLAAERIQELTVARWLTDSRPPASTESDQHPDTRIIRSERP